MMPPSAPLSFEPLPGQALQLWPQRAAFDPALRLLLVADVHFGKARTFRRLGVPVPAGITAESLARLDGLLAATGATELVVLGDLLHARDALAADTLVALRAWRERHAALHWTLVRGNHDHHAGDPPAVLRVQVIDGPLRRGPWALVHQPQAVPGAYALAGHVHPGVRIGGRARDSLRLPCFHFAAQCGVLPAFGGFTGLHLMPRAPGDRLFALADDRVVALPERA